MSLSPHPVGYAEARVARLNRESELTDYRRLSSYLVAARRRGVRRAARATHSHWPVGALSSYSRDRLFRLPACAFHPRDPANAASRSGMWATLTRLLDFQIARASKHASKYHGQKQTETRICTGGRGTMSGTARPAPWLGRPVLSRIGFNSRVVYFVGSHPGWLIQLYPGRDGSRASFHRGNADCVGPSSQRD